MRAPTGLVGLLLRMAVRRWPAEARDEQSREWTAELEALRDEPRSGLRRLGFVVSLAFRPVPGDGAGVRGWREILPGLGQRLRPAAGFAVASLLLMQLVPMRLSIGSVTLPLNWLAVVAVAAGFLVGRRSRLPASASTIGLAGVVTTGAALGYVTHRTMLIWQYSGGHGALHVSVLFASVIFVVSMTALLSGMLRLAAGRRRWTAVALALPGLPLVVLASWAAGAVTYPSHAIQTGVDPLMFLFDVRLRREGFALVAHDSVGSFEVAFLVLGATVLAYGLGVATRRSGAVPAEPVSTTAWHPSRAAVVAGIAGLSVGLASWGFVVSVLAPTAQEPLWFMVGPMPTVQVGVPPQWVYELRWATVALAAVGLTVAAAGRPGAVLAAIVLSGWLLAGDAVVARTSLAEGGAATVLAASAVAVAGVLIARWIVGRRVALTEARSVAVRRSLAVAAVALAACGPLMLGTGMGILTPRLPVGLTVVMGVVPGTFVTLAAFAAASARRRPVRPWLVGLFAVVPASLTVAGGIATTTGIDRSILLLLGVVGGGLFAVIGASAALARPWSSRTDAVTSLAGWIGAAVVTPFVLAPAAVYASVVPTFVLSAVVDGNYRYLETMPFQPGTMMLVIPTMAALARWLVRDAPPEPLPGAGPDPSVHSGPSRHHPLVPRPTR